MSCALALALLATGPGAGAKSAEPVRRALLVGINDYRANDVREDDADWIPQDLRGAVNDVQLIRKVLTSRFGFGDENITVLVDEQATREAIFKALRKLVKQSGPQDILYIHFSGHGSQAADQDGDEDDDLDETILSHDARQGGVRDITDDEIREVLTGLRSTNVLVVLDSCHSGTATRGGAAFVTRSVPMDGRTDLYAEAAGPGKRGLLPESERYVLMTGAASNQSALDGPVDGAYFGFFSYSLGRALGDAPEDATPRDVYRLVQETYARIGSRFSHIAMPEPQLEAPAALLDRPVLRAADGPAPEAAGETARLPWVEARTLGPGEALLAEGVSLGAAVGSRWAVYPPGETAFEPGGAVAAGVVTALRGADAVARLEPPGIELAPASRAVFLAPPPPSRRIPVWLDRVDPELRLDRGRLRKALIEHTAAVELAASMEAAWFIVDVTGGECRVLAAGGLQTVAAFPVDPEAVTEDGLARALGSRLDRSLTVADLLALDNEAARLRVSVRVLPADASGETRTIRVTGAGPAPAYRIHRPDEPRTAANSLRLSVECSEDCFLSVVDVDAAGRVSVIFPNEHSENKGFLPKGLAPGGREILLPDSLQPGNRAGFFWDVAPPAGTDTVQVFATSDLETAEKIRAYVAQVRDAVSTRGSGAGASASFDGLARELARGVTARGIQVVSSEGEPEPTVEQPAEEPPPAEPEPEEPEPARPDWASASATFVIEPEEGD